MLRAVRMKTLSIAGGWSRSHTGTTRRIESPRSAYCHSPGSRNPGAWKSARARRPPQKQRSQISLGRRVRAGGGMNYSFTLQADSLELQGDYNSIGSFAEYEYQIQTTGKFWTARLGSLARHNDLRR